MSVSKDVPGDLSAGEPDLSGPPTGQSLPPHLHRKLEARREKVHRDIKMYRETKLRELESYRTELLRAHLRAEQQLALENEHIEGTDSATASSKPARLLPPSSLKGASGTKRQRTSSDKKKRVMFKIADDIDPVRPDADVLLDIAGPMGSPTAQLNAQANLFALPVDLQAMSLSGNSNVNTSSTLEIKRQDIGQAPIPGAFGSLLSASLQRDNQAMTNAISNARSSYWYSTPQTSDLANVTAQPLTANAHLPISGVKSDAFDSDDIFALDDHIAPSDSQASNSQTVTQTLAHSTGAGTTAFSTPSLLRRTSSQSSFADPHLSAFSSASDSQRPTGWQGHNLRATQKSNVRSFSSGGLFTSTASDSIPSLTHPAADLNGNIKSAAQSIRIISPEQDVDEADPTFQSNSPVKEPPAEMDLDDAMIDDIDETTYGSSAPIEITPMVGSLNSIRRLSKESASNEATGEMGMPGGVMGDDEEYQLEKIKSVENPDRLSFSHRIIWEEHVGGADQSMR
ncbi:uncharacterized protein V1516DRAFT_247507 [Lipomyces oligophaga]|uniref:uncharacterized protein n=1 Tax=Lipomyces oligophaga TaxID=45792 RepID=UPI0034CE0EB9